MYILGINATNIREGGGVTHLVELLKNVEPEKHGFTKVIVWSNRTTLGKVQDRDWLVKLYNSQTDGSLLKRTYWQLFHLKKEAKYLGCDLLFSPGGMDVSGFKPMVTMHRNLLPFELVEVWRYKLSMSTVKFIILRFFQSISYKGADGVIFLTRYAQNSALKVTGLLKGSIAVIPHGVDRRFFIPPRSQKSVSDYSVEKPIRLIYVSSIEPYKHQWNVVEAVSALRKNNIPVTLDLFGSSYSPSLRKLQLSMNKFDPFNDYVKYHGVVEHGYIHKEYLKADIAIFASSCETFGQILIEGMAAGLPIACSNLSAMPELLGDNGVYFNPTDPKSIEVSLSKIIFSTELRSKKSFSSFQSAKQFSWDKCSDDTFKFLKSCLENFYRKEG